jgi:hypothetical protein
MDGQERPRNRDQFEIAIICALALEANAVLCSLDEIRYDAPPSTAGPPEIEIVMSSAEVEDTLSSCSPLLGWETSCRRTRRPPSI